MEQLFRIGGQLLAVTLADHALREEIAGRYHSFAAEAAPSLPLLFRLRQTFTAPDPDVDRREGTQHELAFEHYRGYLKKTADGTFFSISDPDSKQLLSQMHCSSDFRQAECWLSGDVQCQAAHLNDYLMILYAFATMDRQTLLFHASVVTLDGKAYLFLGRSGTGKSTHAALWLRHIEGTELLNDDNPVVTVHSGELRAYGSPWSGKTSCYRSLSFPVGGIVLLRQADCNAIRRLPSVQAVAALMPHISGAKYEPSLYQLQLQSIIGLAASMPIYQLDCLPDAEAAWLCCEALGGQVRP